MKKLLGLMIVAMCIIFTTSCKEDKVIIGGEITQVTVNSFPMTDPNGSVWDFLLGADANPDIELWFNRGGAISDEALFSVWLKTKFVDIII